MASEEPADPERGGPLPAVGRRPWRRTTSIYIVLPASLVSEVLSGLHDSPVRGHLGVNKKTLEKVQRRFYWPS